MQTHHPLPPKHLAITILVVSALALSSCKTVRVAETIVTHDTLHVRHTDTLRDTKYVTLHDTIVRESFTTLVQDSAGRILHHYVTNNNYHARITTDTARHSSHIRDTVYVKEASAVKSVKSTTHSSFMSHVKTFLSGAMLSLLLAFLALFLFKMKKAK